MEQKNLHSSFFMKEGSVQQQLYVFFGSILRLKTHLQQSKQSIPASFSDEPF